ncbi:MAG TPA: hypothetical protein VJ501_14025, partial [Burkholderiaceae bacterium]|nr:hypothetical protein [Burkholderiaceae bacterium]
RTLKAPAFFRFLLGLSRSAHSWAGRRWRGPHGGLAMLHAPRWTCPTCVLVGYRFLLFVITLHAM